MPEIEALLQAAVERGEPASGQTTRLLQLLDDYGANALRTAVKEALERSTPRASSVAYLLTRAQRRPKAPPLPAVHLERRPDLEDLHVQAPNLETYDELAGCDTDD